MSLPGVATRTFHVFLASPGDVNKERQAVRNFFDDYNRTVGPRLRFVVLDWENYATAGVGRPQELITANTLEKYRNSLALVIGIMDQRFGSPTGEFESGTEEEFKWAMESNRNNDGFPEIKWFFRERRGFSANTTDLAEIQKAVEQFTKVQEFQHRLQEEGEAQVFCKTYQDADDFTETLRADLNPWLSADERPWMSAEKDNVAFETPTEETATEVTLIPRAPHAYVEHQYLLLNSNTGLIGRRAELDLLDSWASDSGDDGARVFSIVAVGGMGKSALTWHWFRERASDAFSGSLAGRMWWSFYERDSGYEQFIDRALAYVTRSVTEVEIEELKSKYQSLKDKEDELYRHLDQKPYVIVLDGLERVLFAYAGLRAAYVLDEAVTRAELENRPRHTIDIRAGRFLARLTRARASRILISTRLHPAILEDQWGECIAGSRRFELGGLNDDDAVTMFNRAGNTGTRKLMLAQFKRFDCHPLLLEALSKMIAGDPRWGKNFDKWFKKNPGFDLFALPLKQTKSHVIKYILEQVDAAHLRVLQVIAAFRAPADYEDLSRLLVGSADKPFSDEDRLIEALRQLQDQGLLGCDDRTDKFRYDLHPIVRGVVWNDTKSDDQQYVNAQLESHFREYRIPAADEVSSSSDLQFAVELFNVLLRQGKAREALELLENRFAGPLRDIPGGKGVLVELIDDLWKHEDGQAVLRERKELAQEFSYDFRACSSLGRAAELYRIHNRDCGVAQLCATHEARLFHDSGQLYESAIEVIQCLAAELRLITFAGGIPYSFLCSLNATLDSSDIQTLVAPLSAALVDDAHANQQNFLRDRSYGYWNEVRDFRYDFEFRRQRWDAAIELARDLSSLAEEIGSDLLQAGSALKLGNAFLEKGDVDVALKHQQQAIEKSRQVNDLGIEIAAVIGMARCQLLKGDSSDARQLLGQIAEPSARGPFRLLQAEMALVQADLERAEGNTDAEHEALRAAYGFAWCDGPPFCYQRILSIATKRLEEADASLPTLPAFDSRKRTPPFAPPWDGRPSVLKFSNEQKDAFDAMWPDWGQCVKYIVALSLSSESAHDKDRASHQRVRDELMHLLFRLAREESGPIRDAAIRGLLVQSGFKGSSADRLAVAMEASMTGPSEVITEFLDDQDDELRRNAAVLCTTLWADDQSIASRLPEFLRDDSPAVRRSAVTAVGRLDTDTASFRDSIARLLCDPDQSVQTSAICTVDRMSAEFKDLIVALGPLDFAESDGGEDSVNETVHDVLLARNPNALEYLYEQLRDADADLRTSATRLLKVFAERDSRWRELYDESEDEGNGVDAEDEQLTAKIKQRLRELLEDDVVAVRFSAVTTLARFGGRPADSFFEQLPELLQDEDLKVRMLAIEAMDEFRVDSEPWAANLIEGLRSDNLEWRNACHKALASCPSAAPKLAKLLNDGAPETRLAAIKILDEMEEHSETLLPGYLALLSDSSSPVRIAALQSLRHFGSSATDGIPALLDLLEDSDSEVRTLAIERLADFTTRADQLAQPLLEMLDDAELTVKVAAASAVERFGAVAADAESRLVSLLDVEDVECQAAALEAMCSIGTDLAPYADAVLRGIHSDSWALRSAARRALKTSSGAMQSVLERLLEDDDDEIRTVAIESLQEKCVNFMPHLTTLIEYLEAEDYSLRDAARRAIISCGDNVVPRLFPLLEDGPSDVRVVAIQILCELDADLTEHSSILIEGLTGEWELRNASHEALRKLGTGILPDLSRLLDNEDIEVKTAVVRTMAQIGDDLAPYATAFLECVRSDDEDLQNAAGEALSKCGRNVVPQLSELLKGSDDEIRAITIQAISAIEENMTPYSAHLIEGAKTDSRKLRFACRTALAQCDGSVLPELSRLLDHHEEEVQACAIEVISRIGADDAFVERLLNFVKDGSWEVKSAAREALARCPELSMPRLVELMDYPDEDLQSHIIRVIAEAETDLSPYVSRLIAGIANDSWELRDASTEALVKWGEAGIPHLLDVLHEGTDEQRASVLQVLSKIGGNAELVIPAVSELLQSPSSAVRSGAVRVLSRYGQAAESVAIQLTELATDESADVRAAALAALRENEVLSVDHVPSLINALTDESWSVRENAVDALRALGPAASMARAQLQQLLRGKGGEEFRDQVQDALLAIGTQE